MWALSRQAGLEENSPYAYVMWGEYFAATSVVATSDGKVVGLVTGFRVPEEPDALFVWQVGVDSACRGAGIGAAMLDELVERLPWLVWLEATVTPSNAASAALFRGFGQRHGAPVSEELAFGEEMFPGEGHEAEIRFRIGPVRQRAG